MKRAFNSITLTGVRRVLFIYTVTLFFALPSAAQSPQPQPQPGSQLPNLKPLALVNVALDGVAKPLGSSPTGIQAAPEFFVPRSTSKTFEIRTRDGRSSVHFSNTLPSGVPANAFSWQQASVAAPNAVGRLVYNACQSCPASFTIGVRAEDPSGAVSGQIKINLTTSTAKPSLTSITRSGGTDTKPRFEIRFGAGTFDTADSEIVASYADNLKYRLIPENGSNFSGGSMLVVIPRLKAERGVQVALRNPYGASSSSSVNLPTQARESNPPFECVNCSTVLGSVTVEDAFSVKHTNSGFTTINGTDTITITPLQSGKTPCDQEDFLYTGARASWINDNGTPVTSIGTVNITGQPPLNQLLRATQNRITANWSLNALNSNRFYQVVFGGIKVVGTCSNRIIQ